jgi:ABC-2 type transport system permease protein
MLVAARAAIAEARLLELADLATRISDNVGSAGRGAAGIFSGVTLAVWYLLWIALAAACLWFAARPGSEAVLAPHLAKVFFGVFVYWQVGPVVLGVTGAALDLRKLLAFPIPRNQLFSLEILLRLATGLEVLLAAAGLVVGLTLNPEVGVKSAPLALFLYVLFNLFLGAGLKYQIEGLLKRKRLREVLVFLLVLTAALPQLFARIAVPAPLRGAASVFWLPWWPWSAASNLALGHIGGVAIPVAVGWTLLALIYGGWAFERGLRSDQGAPVPLRPDRSPAHASRWEALSHALSRLLPGAIAALAEKEIRTLVRAPRFRLVFVMGFTFGVLIFLPMLMRNRAAGVDAPSYQLALVCGYALLLLGDMLFWNIFGYDRAAARFYFVQPLDRKSTRLNSSH